MSKRLSCQLFGIIILHRGALLTRERERPRVSSMEKSTCLEGLQEMFTVI